MSGWLVVYVSFCMSCMSWGLQISPIRLLIVGYAQIMLRCIYRTCVHGNRHLQQPSLDQCKKKEDGLCMFRITFCSMLCGCFKVTARALSAVFCICAILSLWWEVIAQWLEADVIRCIIVCQKPSSTYLSDFTSTEYTVYT